MKSPEVASAWSTVGSLAAGLRSKETQPQKICIGFMNATRATDAIAGTGKGSILASIFAVCQLHAKTVFESIFPAEVHLSEVCSCAENAKEILPTQKVGGRVGAALPYI